MKERVPGLQTMLKIKDRIPIRNQVLNQLRESILTNKIAPGKRLYEEKLAAEIGTSRTPVREALHVLEREGLVEAIPRIGYVVKVRNMEDFDEIAEIRYAIESLAAIWTARRLNDTTLMQFQSILDKSKKLVDQRNIKKFIDMDAQFHELIALASGRKRICQMIRDLRSYMMSRKINTANYPEFAQKVLAGHERIIKAITGKNEEMIRQAISAHLSQFREDFLIYSSDKGAAESAKGQRVRDDRD
jgi:GntR family transcriptional regulator, rspAB operon transcriptional repressor